MPPPDASPATQPLMRDILTAMERLEAVLAAETAAMAAGRLRDALRFGEEKSAAFAAWQALLPEVAEARASGMIGAADRALLARRQEAFDAVIDRNIAVLTTLRGVSEDILREVSARLAPTAPAAYGPPGAATRAAASAPLTLSRNT